MKRLTFNVINAPNQPLFNSLQYDEHFFVTVNFQIFLFFKFTLPLCEHVESNLLCYFYSSSFYKLYIIIFVTHLMGNQVHGPSTIALEESNSYFMSFIYSLDVQISVSWASQAFDQSIAFVGGENIREKSLYHAKGFPPTIWKQESSKRIRCQAMINSKNLIFWDEDENQFSIICLQTYQIRKIKHSFPKQFKDIQIMTFSQTQLFCFIIRIRQDSNKIFFYNYNKLGEKGQLLGKYEWAFVVNNRPTPRQLNHHSKIGWIQKSWNDTYDFVYFQVQKGKLKLNQLKIQLLDHRPAMLEACWELQPNKYLIEARFKIIHSPTYFEFTPLTDLMTFQPANNQGGPLRKCQFQLDGQPLNFERYFRKTIFGLNEQLIIYAGSQQLVQGKGSHRFVVDTKTQKVVSAEKVPQSIVKSQWVVGYEPSIFVEEYHLKSPTQFRINYSKQRIKDIYMHSLLHLNEDFDDDLLLDAMQQLAP